MGQINNQVFEEVEMVFTDLNESYESVKKFESSNIFSISFDKVNKELYVMYKPKDSTPPSVYKYSDIDYDSWKKLGLAESKGKELRSIIKGKQYFRIL